MSRTTKDQPYRIRAQNAPAHQVEEWHFGCDRDPEGRKRYVRTEVEIIDLAPHWHQKDVVVGHALFGNEITSRRWVFEAVHTENRVRIFETVPCDIDAPDNGYRLKCSHEARIVGRGHHCYWPKRTRRAKWYAPERQDGRQSLREMADEYNTYGDIETDEPWTPASPNGLWGGGWID